MRLKHSSGKSKGRRHVTLLERQGVSGARIGNDEASRCAHRGQLGDIADFQQARHQQAHVRSGRVSFLRNQCRNGAGRDNSCDALGKQGGGGQRHDSGLIDADEGDLLHITTRLGHKPV
jgi:hypothetical protein